LRRVVAEVEDQAGELFRPVGFIVTNVTLRNQSVVLKQSRKRRALDQKGKQATPWTRLHCHRFRADDVRLQLSVLASNLGNLWRRLVSPSQGETWSLISLQQRLINTAGDLDRKRLSISPPSRPYLQHEGSRTTKLHRTVKHGGHQPGPDSWPWRVGQPTESFQAG
jgi:hypothetical protein